MKTLLVVLTLLTVPALAQVPAGTGGTAADADRGDFAPPSTGCGNAECEIAAACATADPGVAFALCAQTVRTSNAIRLAALPPAAPVAPVVVVVEPPATEPILFEADGVTAKPGRAPVKLKAGVLTPYAGWLTDPQEKTHRGQINTRNEAELVSLKTGTVVIDTPLFITIEVGIFVAGGVGGGVIGAKAAEKRPGAP